MTESDGFEVEITMKKKFKTSCSIWLFGLILLSVLSSVCPAQGVNWEQTNGLGDAGRVFSLFAASDNTLYAGTDDGVFSLVENTDWLPSRLTLSAKAVTALGSTIYAGTPEGVYRLEPNGLWTRTLINASITGLQIWVSIAQPTAETLGHRSA